MQGTTCYYLLSVTHKKIATKHFYLLGGPQAHTYIPTGALAAHTQGQLCGVMLANPALAAGTDLCVTELQEGLLHMPGACTSALALALACAGLYTQNTQKFLHQAPYSQLCSKLYSIICLLSFTTKQPRDAYGNIRVNLPFYPFYVAMK